MKLPKLTPSVKIIAIAAAGLLLAFLMERLIFSTIRAKTQNLYSQIKAAEADFKIGLELQKRKDSIQQEYAAYKSYLKTSAADPDQKIIADFISEVENIARETGISIINLKPAERVEREKSYKKCSLELRAEASLSKVYDFLYKIQTSKLLIKVERLIVASKDLQSGNFKLDTTISMVVL